MTIELPLLRRVHPVLHICSCWQVSCRFLHVCIVYTCSRPSCSKTTRPLSAYTSRRRSQRKNPLRYIEIDFDRKCIIARDKVCYDCFSIDCFSSFEGEGDSIGDHFVQGSASRCGFNVWLFAQPLQSQPISGVWGPKALFVDPFSLARSRSIWGRNVNPHAMCQGHHSGPLAKFAAQHARVRADA